MKKVFLIQMAIFAFINMTSAQTSLTWANDIAPILYKNCASCHRDKGIAPFPLETYSQAIAYKASIKSAVIKKHMPPFPPDISYQRYAHERVLTDIEIQKIAQWADNGAPSGMLNQAPIFPAAPVAGSQIGTPDLVLRAPVYKIKESQDVYRCFVIPTKLAQGRYLSGMEVIPGNRQVVHHVLVYQDSTGKSLALDAKDPDPGYVSFGGPGFNGAEQVGSWVPGATPMLLPQGLGQRIAKDGYLVVQIHYPAGAAGKTDSTKLNLFFTKGTGAVRQCSTLPLLNHTTSLINGPLKIPANTKKKFIERFKLNNDVSVMYVAPHMHLIGRNMKVYGIKPAGDTLKLINIKDWNFHWQGGYAFKKITKIPAGTTLYAEADYDNTTTNPWNPSNPPKDVVQGEATFDEMMLVYFTAMFYRQGDENISLESVITASEENPTLTQDYSFEVAPNPVTNQLNLKIGTPKDEIVDILLYDKEGRLIKIIDNNEQLQAGTHHLTFDMSEYQRNLYFLQIRTNDGRFMTKKIIKE